MTLILFLRTMKINTKPELNMQIFFCTQVWRFTIERTPVSKGQLAPTRLILNIFSTSSMIEHSISVEKYVTTCLMSRKGQSHFNTIIRQYSLISSVTVNPHPISSHFHKLTRNLLDASFTLYWGTTITLTRGFFHLEKQ